MWTAVFDAAGHESDQDYLVVAGFVARIKHWVDFESQWTKRLQSDGLDYYHHSEHSKRAALVSDLIDSAPTAPH